MRRSAAALALALLLPLPGLAGEVTVKPGETLSEIAERYGTSVERLMQLNNLRSPQDLWAGSRIQVPGAGGSTARGGGGSGSGNYTVKNGETLSEIAERYGTSVDRLMQLNGLRSPQDLWAGSRIQVPGASPARPTSTSTAKAPVNRNAREHKVQPGETLSEIADRYGIPMERLVSLNNLSKPNDLQAGATIKLRSPASTTAARPPVRPRPTTVASKPAAKPTPKPAASTTTASKPAAASNSRPAAAPSTPTKVVAATTAQPATTQAISPAAAATSRPATVAARPTTSTVTTAAATGTSQPGTTTPTSTAISPATAAASRPAPATSKPAATASVTPTTTAAATSTPAAATTRPAATTTTASAKPAKPASPDWRSYGPLQVDWANWQPMAGSYVAPSLNSEGQPLYLAVNCTARRLNATGQSGTWKTWDAPQSDFEEQLITDLCKAKGS